MSILGIKRPILSQVNGMNFSFKYYKNLNQLAFYFVFYTLVTYPLFYFAYKFNLPKIGSSDIYQYLRMYQDPFNFSAADGPFVYRQLASSIVHFVEKAGIYYDTQISFNDPNFSQRFYFAALLVNWVSLVIASCVISIYYENNNKGHTNNLSVILVCLIFFVGFSGVFHGLSESLDGVSVALAICCYVAYKKQFKFLFSILLLTSIFQREMLLPMFGLVLFTDIARKIYLRKFIDQALIWMFLVSILGCLAYLLVRIYLLPDTSGIHSNQISITQSVTHFLNPGINFEFIRQVLLTQNTLILTMFIYFTLIPKDERKNNEALSDDLYAVFAAFLCLFIFGLAAGIGNNIGRILMYGTPFYMTLLFHCLQLKTNQNRSSITENS